MAIANLGKIKPLWRGSYSSTETYRPLDFLKNGGVTYICTVEATGIAPPNLSYFEAVIDDQVSTMTAYAISQLAGGDAALIGVITSGTTVDSYDWMIYPTDGRIYEVGSVTGTLAGDFDPDTGVDTGLSGALDDFNIVDSQASLSSSIATNESDISANTASIETNVTNIGILQNRVNKSITVDFASDADLTLTTAQNEYGRIILTDTGSLLTSERELIIDDSERAINVKNNTDYAIKVVCSSGGDGIRVESNCESQLISSGVSVFSGIGNIEFLLEGFYTTSTISYPDGKSESDYESLTLSSGTSSTEIANAATLMSQKISSGWSALECWITSANISRITRQSSTSYTVSRTGSTTGVTQLVGVLKSGVTY